jgi:hypothetical protein
MKKFKLFQKLLFEFLHLLSLEICGFEIKSYQFQFQLKLLNANEIKN